MSNEIDILGKLLMSEFRDTAIKCCEGLIEGKFDSPGHREIQSTLASITQEQKELIRKCIVYCVDGGLNDFLFHLDEAIRTKNGISI